MKYIPLWLVFTTSAFFAQEKIEFVEINEIIALMNQAEEAGDFDTAVEVINKIKKNDSAYCSGLSSKSFYLLQDGHYDDVIVTADEGLSNKCAELDNIFYVNKAAAYINEEAYGQGLLVVEEGLKHFPFNKQLNYNKALCLEKLERLAEASEAYKQVILIDPLDGAAHLMLGNICYKQELITQALMCFNMYVLLNTGDPSVNSVIESLNTVVAASNSNSRNPSLIISKDDTSFKDIDLILNQKIAINKKYETGLKIDLALVKQNHAMMTKLLDFKGNDGFWSRKYVPFFKWIMESDHFDLFTYTSLYTVENTKIQKIIKKNEEQIEAFLPAVVNKWQEVLGGNGTNYYYDNGYLQGVGSSSVAEPTGKWDYYTENGMLFLEANYDEDSKNDGAWKWYYPSGIVKEIANYKEGVKQGKNIMYHEDGKTYIETTLKDDKIDGEYTMYYENGALLRSNTYKNDKLEGPYKAYFRTGKERIEYDLEYKNDLIEGVFKEYHANGAVFKEVTYKEGKKNGVETIFTAMNEKISETSYQNDILEGPYTVWYSNGIIKEQGTYVNGLIHGDWKDFHNNGAKATEATYVEEKVDGSSKVYNRDGTLLTEYTYKRGEIIAYKFYDREGNVIKEDKKRGGEFNYESYTADGVLTSKGVYDVQGGRRTGKWVFYTDKGFKDGEGTYTNDLANGEYTYYFPNGNVKVSSNYKEDALDGYYVEYYENGNMNTQGWYVNGTVHGEWRMYYPDGSLSSIYFYQGGNLHGEQMEYAVGEKIERISTYNKGMLVKDVFYTVDGAVHEEVIYNKDEDAYTTTINHYNNTPRVVISYKRGVKNGPYTKFDIDGNKVFEGNYINDAQDGKWTWYYPNGNVDSTQDFVLNQRHGKFLDYAEDGTLIADLNYVYGVLDGSFITYYDNGNPRTKATYSAGERDKRFESYSPKGTLGLARIYDFGRIVGYTYLDESGNEKPLIPMVNQTGLIKSYYPNGTLARELDFVKGNLEGNAKTFAENGKLLYSTAYKFDNRNGIDIDYHINGNLKYEEHYLNDVLHGSSKKYHENGQLKESCEYRFGNKEGECLVYDVNGKLLKKEYYFDGNITKVER